MSHTDVISKAILPGLKEKRFLQKRDIAGHLYRRGDLSKPEICRLTNMTSPTIARLLDELILEGWVRDLGQGTSIGGKRPRVFSINEQAALVLGVDIGREQTRIAVFDLKHQPIGDIHTYPSRLETAPPDEVLADITRQVDLTLSATATPRSRLKVAGVALPGLIDRRGNTFTYLAYESPGLRQRLQDIWKLPVFIDNDSNVMAMGEHAFGVAKGINNVLCISINECVGLGMILDSRLYVGASGMAGEFGHIRLSGLNDPCHCGKVGCLETVASSRAILKNAEQRGIRFPGIPHPTLAHLVDAARHDNLPAIELLQLVGEKIGEGIATLLHLLDPDMIVIGGEITRAGDLLLVPTRQALNKFALARIREHCHLQLSNLGENATILGTQMIAIERLQQERGAAFALYE